MSVCVGSLYKHAILVAISVKEEREAEKIRGGERNMKIYKR
jgi:hypothetical protein